MKPTDVVRGAARLVEIFGEWPSFHDAEVLDVRLCRRGRGDFDGPVLYVRIHLFQGRQDRETPSGFRWFNHTQATFRFGRVCGVEIGGFNNQNAIFDLRIEEAGASPLGPDHRVYRVSIEPAYGVAASFLCDSVEISEIEPGIPPGSVYSGE